jgi:Ala-tRNA(Pro) deacylase
MPLRRIRQYLEENAVPFSILTHPPAFTAQKVAAAAHVPGREVAKTVIVKIDDRLAMAVLPADCTLDLDHLRSSLGAATIELASEWDFKDRFPDCEAGAMPPFGNLYDMPVYVADVLARDEFVAFSACSHREMIRLRFADYARLVQPKVLDISWHRPRPA